MKRWNFKIGNLCIERIEQTTLLYFICSWFIKNFLEITCYRKHWSRISCWWIFHTYLHVLERTIVLTASKIDRCSSILSLSISESLLIMSSLVGFNRLLLALSCRSWKEIESHLLSIIRYPGIIIRGFLKATPIVS